MNIPVEMMEADRWCIYVLGDGQGHKRSKIPYSPITRRKTATNKPWEWVSYETALNAYNNAPRPQNCGLGFFLGDGFCCLDIDEIQGGISTDNPEIDRAMYFTNQTYTEVSQSGTGIHCFFKVDDEIPPHGSRGKKHELYSDGHFIAVTGNALGSSQLAYLEADQFTELVKAYGLDRQDKPISSTVFDRGDRPTLSDEQVLSDMFNSKNGQAIRRLFYDGYHPDPVKNDDDSAKDMALCNQLAFFSFKNPEQMDRLFRQSALYRDKWDERHGGQTYADMTISEAVNTPENERTPKKRIKYDFSFLKKISQ